MNGSYEWREAPKATYAVVGDPVSHSLSPAMQNAAFQAAGMEGSYAAVRVPVEEFDEAMAHLAAQGYKGVNVTVPLKEAAWKWAQSRSRTDSRIGGLNTLDLVGKRGTNTDAPGLIDTLRDLGLSAPYRALLLGAGGTARAFLVALEEEGVEVLAWNRTRINLERAVRDTGTRPQIIEAIDPSGCSLIVNATASSLNGLSIDVDWYSAPRTAIAYDTFYTQGQTVFQRDAEANGLRSVDGRTLLVAQGARSFEWWTGIPAPREAMLNAVQ